VTDKNALVFDQGTQPKDSSTLGSTLEAGWDEQSIRNYLFRSTSPGGGGGLGIFQTIAEGFGNFVGTVVSGVAGAIAAAIAGNPPTDNGTDAFRPIVDALRPLIEEMDGLVDQIENGVIDAAPVIQELRAKTSEVDAAVRRAATTAQTSLNQADKASAEALQAIRKSDRLQTKTLGIHQGVLHNQAILNERITNTFKAMDWTRSRVGVLKQSAIPTHRPAATWIIPGYLRVTYADDRRASIEFHPPAGEGARTWSGFFIAKARASNGATDIGIFRVERGRIMTRTDSTNHQGDGSTGIHQNWGYMQVGGPRLIGVLWYDTVEVQIFPELNWNDMGVVPKGENSLRPIYLD